MRRFHVVMGAMAKVEDVKVRRCGVCQLVWSLIGVLLRSSGLLDAVVVVREYAVPSGSLSIVLLI
jgi:hypothetical protein